MIEERDCTTCESRQTEMLGRPLVDQTGEKYGVCSDARSRFYHQKVGEGKCCKHHDKMEK